MLSEKFFSDKAELLNALQAHCLSVLGDVGKRAVKTR